MARNKVTKIKKKTKPEEEQSKKSEEEQANKDLETRKLEEEQSKKSEEEQSNKDLEKRKPEEEQSNDDFVFHPCTRFDRDKDFGDKKVGLRIQGFFQQLYPLRNENIADMHKNVLPTMKYYKNGYGKTDPLYLWGKHPKDAHISKLMNEDVVTFLCGVFPNNRDDKRAIERNVKENYYLCICNGREKDPNKPYVVAAIVFQLQENHAFVNWLAVHPEYFHKQTVGYYRRQQLSTFLLYVLFKGITTEFLKKDKKFTDEDVNASAVWLQVSPVERGLQSFYCDLGFKKRTNLVQGNGFEILERESSLQIKDNDFISTLGQAELFSCTLPEFGFWFRIPCKQESTVTTIELTKTEIGRATKCYQSNDWLLLAKQRLSFNHCCKGKELNPDRNDFFNQCKSQNKNLWVSYPKCYTTENVDGFKPLFHFHKELHNLLESFTSLSKLMRPFNAEGAPAPLCDYVTNMQPARVSVLSRLIDSPTQWLNREHMMFMLNVMYRNNLHFDDVKIVSPQYIVIGKSLALLRTKYDQKMISDNVFADKQLDLIKQLYRMMMKDNNMDMLDTKIIFVIIHQDYNHWTIVVLLNMDEMVKRIDVMHDRNNSEMRVDNDLLSVDNPEKSGYLHVDSLDRSGKGMYELPTEHGLQALVNASYSLRYMHINHSDRMKMTKEKTGRISQRACDDLVSRQYRQYELLNSNNKHLTPTSNFKKHVLSKDVLPTQQDTWNCGVAALYSTMLLSNLLIDKVDNAHTWLPKDRHNNQTTVTVPLEMFDTVVEKPDSQFLNKFRIEIYAFMDACARLIRQQSNKLLDDWNDVLRHCYYRPTPFLDGLDYAFSNLAETSLVQNSFKSKIDCIPVLVETDANMLNYALVLASYNAGIDVTECSKAKEVKNVMMHNLKNFYNSLNKEDLFQVENVAFADNTIRNHLTQRFKFDVKRDIKKRDKSKALGTISKLINEEKNCNMNTLDPVCMLMLFAKFIKQDVVLYKISKNEKVTFFIANNEKECRRISDIKSHSFSQVACQFVLWKPNDHWRLALLVDVWPPVDVPKKDLSNKDAAARTLLHLKKSGPDTVVTKLIAPSAMSKDTPIPVKPAQKHKVSSSVKTPMAISTEYKIPKKANEKQADDSTKAETVKTRLIEHSEKPIQKPAVVTQQTQMDEETKMMNELYGQIDSLNVTNNKEHSEDEDIYSGETKKIEEKEEFASDKGEGSDEETTSEAEDNNARQYASSRESDRENKDDSNDSNESENSNEEYDDNEHSESDSEYEEEEEEEGEDNAPLSKLIDRKRKQKKQLTASNLKRKRFKRRLNKSRKKRPLPKAAVASMPKKNYVLNDSSDSSDQEGKSLTSQFGICCALDRCNMLTNHFKIHRRVPKADLRQKCSICKQVGHRKCFGKDNVCLKCEAEENNDENPFYSTPNERLPEINKITSREMWMDTKGRDLREVGEATKRKFGLRPKQNPFSTKNFKKVKEVEMDKQFEKYVMSAFQKWGNGDDDDAKFWRRSSNPANQDIMLQEIQDEIDNCAVCKKKKMRQLKRQQSQIVLNKKIDTFEMCDDCCDKVDTMNTYKLTWKHAKKVLSKRYQASLPGFVLGLKYVDKTKVIAECGYYDRQNEFVKTKLNVDFSWVVRTYGQEYAAFLVAMSESGDKFVPLKETLKSCMLNADDDEIRIERVITRIKYEPPVLHKNYKELLITRKDDSKTPATRTPGVFHCQDATGMSFVVDEKDLRNKVDNEYIDLIKAHATTDGFVNVPVGSVRKTSSLHKHPKLVVNDAPSLKYLQGDEDLCVVKSFVSALHCIGLETEADKIDREYEMRKLTAVTKATAMETTIEIARQVLPRSFEYQQFGPGEFDYTSMKKHSIFLGCIETSDGHANHAVTLFQDFIFDSNEKTALRLCKEGMDYCSNDGTDTVQFKQFARGYLMKCTLQGWKNTFARLKKTRKNRSR